MIYCLIKGHNGNKSMQSIIEDERKGPDGQHIFLSENGCGHFGLKLLILV